MSQKIMALGDSITYGQPVNGGYRLLLQNILAANGLSYDFVGPQTGNSTGMTDPEHAGFVGYRIDEIQTQVAAMSSSYAPDFILLDAGSNDLYQAYDLPNIASRLDALINDLRAKWPLAYILVATIGPYTTTFAELPGYDAHILALTTPYVVPVDMAANMTIALLADGEHPNAAGYQRMAEIWFGYLEGIYTQMNRIIELVQAQDLILEGSLSRANAGLEPYLNFDGATNYAHVMTGEYRGLLGFTAGGWFQGGAAGALMSVWQPAPAQIWRLYLSTNKPTLGISSTGSNELTVQNASALSASTWYFIAARYTPSTEIALWVNNTKTVNTTAIPASLYDVLGAHYVIGGESGGSNLLTGKACLCFFCSAVVPDIYLTALYQMTHHLFH